MLSASFVIPATHPSLVGHFPGNPIVPGVIALDYVVRGLTDQLRGSSLSELPQVKFLLPLLPEVEVTTIYKRKCETLYQFSCEFDGTVILLGQVRLVIGVV